MPITAVKVYRVKGSGKRMKPSEVSKEGRHRQTYFNDH